MTRLPTLDQLAATVVADTESDDPLDQLTTAARARDALDDLSDALLGRFVEQARASGSSWSQIGSALGVTKQAAQQRHTTPDSVARRLLARVPSPHGSGFTPRARACVAEARSAAQRLGHNFIGTEHLLLGLFAVPEGVAARVLAGLGVTKQSIEARVKEEINAGGTAMSDDLPLTPRAQNALHHTQREALQLGHNYVGTEHILLALISEDQGLAVRLLAAEGLQHAEARAAIVKTLTGMPPA